MIESEKEEALVSVCSHYGFPIFMEMLIQIVERINAEVMTIPLPSGDPEKAALALYAKRMQAEGAQALKNALQNKIQALKSKTREKKQNG